MFTASVSKSTKRELNALQKVLLDYIDVSKRNISDVLSKKTNDIRIGLFRGFYAERFKGPRKGAKNSEGVAFRQMRQRAKAGKGVRLGSSGAPSAKAPVEYYQLRRLRGRAGTYRRLRVPVTMSTYQRQVWTELASRQAGIGVLGVAFLMQRFRKRFSKSQGGYVATGSSALRENKTALPQVQISTQEDRDHKTIGKITLGPTSARIEGFVPGQMQVGERHSILAVALRGVREDTEKYLVKKSEASAKALLEASGLKTA